MRYLGIDVHSKACVWCLLNAQGEIVEQGSTETTIPALQALVTRLGKDDELLAGQEVGAMAYLVHDALKEAGVRLLSFNAAHLRMIAASRKKTDRRDAYWIARALQTGMTPHEVYIPVGEVRELRGLLHRREVIQRDFVRWRHRAKSQLRASGLLVSPGLRNLRGAIAAQIESCTEGVDGLLLDGIGLCERNMELLSEELAHVDAQLRRRTEHIEAIQRLMTIPGVGDIVATTLYACIGDVTRFPNAKSLAAYVGLVPSVRQSADTNVLGRITKQGAPQLRRLLVQAAHAVSSRCQTDAARPIQSTYERIRGTRGRRKVALVALARHLLRLGYYILRDGTCYDAERLGAERTAAAA